jgi:hypothetical protein
MTNSTELESAENAALSRRYERVLEDIENLVPRLFPTYGDLAAYIRIKPNRLTKFRHPEKYSEAIPTRNRSAQLFVLETLEQVVERNRWHLISWPLDMPPGFEPPDDSYHWYWQKLERLKAVEQLAGSPEKTLDGLRLMGEFCVDSELAPAHYRAPLAVTSLLCLGGLASYPERLQAAPRDLLSHRLGNARLLRDIAVASAGEAYDPDLRDRFAARAASYAGVFLFYAGCELGERDTIEEGLDALASAVLAPPEARADAERREGRWFNLMLAADRSLEGREITLDDALREHVGRTILSVLDETGDPHASYRYRHHPFQALRSFIQNERLVLHRRLEAA